MTLKDEVEEAGLLVYGRACPNCGGFVSDRRLEKGLPCSSCLPEPPVELSVREVYRTLRKLGTLKAYRVLHEVTRTYDEICHFFRKCVGNDPWSIQRLWIKRIAKKASFAMIAPTGVGKTTFGSVVALYLAMRGHKSYFIVPTTALAMQLERKLEEMSSRAGIVVRFVAIHSKLKKREREAREKALEDPQGFDILVTTSNYLLRNPGKILKHDFKFIFVDDVDAILKGSKAINYVLQLLGFTEKDLERALQAIRLKRELVFRGENTKLLEKLNQIEETLERRKRKVNKVLIIASATGNPRGTRVKLFKELLGFEIGARPEFIRNIVDTYKLPEGDIKETTLRLIRKLGRGGLIYVPIDKGVDYAVEIADYLKKQGIMAAAVHSKNVVAIDKFAKGELDVLVGVATYYGILVRGIDLPEVIRYAIFVGPPRHKINLRLEGIKPQDVLRLLPLVRDAVEDNERRREIDAHIVRLRRYLRRAGMALIQALNEVLEGKREPSTVAEREFMEAYQLLKNLLTEPEILESIRRNPNVAVYEEGSNLYVLIPDAPTYIQASGRTSRLYLGGISKGLSVVIVDDERILNGLERRLRWMIDDFKFIPLDEVRLDEILTEIDRTRELIRRIREGRIPREMISKEGPLKLKTALLVVESPNKARTIAKFFGRPSVREYGRLRVYEANLGNYTLLITASGGHIYDLITELNENLPTIHGIVCRKPNNGKGPKFVPIYTTLKRCNNCGHQFTVELNERNPRCPYCGSTNVMDSVRAVEALRDVALEVDEILVGTDPDTEGEKIAFDITNVVLPVNRNVLRVEFHEVTRRAIINAVNNPRKINYDLVKAQLVRRIEDRWIGFSLSRKLQTEFWQEFCKKKLKALLKARKDQEEGARIDKRILNYLERYAKLCKTNPKEYRNLSAGRVQTPVLGWIIDAYDRHMKSKTLFLILWLEELRLEIPIPESKRRKMHLNKVKSVIAEVKYEEIVETQVNPLPPYTTDSALYDISSKYGIPAPKAMQILQDLFELGFITYHRTDSTRVSDVGIGVAREYMKERFGDRFEDYFQPRTWGEGGAHECIRPTRPIDAETLRNLINEGIIEPVRRLTRAHFAVYDLIFRRFMASQSKPAIVKKAKGVARVSMLLSDGSVVELDPLDFEVYFDIIFDGFTVFYRYFNVRRIPREGKYIITDTDNASNTNNENKNKFRLKEWYREPLHTQASLIREMKEKEIGRPSTYAKIVDTLFKRHYVAYIAAKGKGGRRELGIVPLPLGREVYSYLQSKYEKLVSEERTRFLEKRMKEVEDGKARYEELLDELYDELRQFKIVEGGCFERR